MAGGVQARGNSRIKHGFPRVPNDVTQAHVLRRYLQSLRDSLNEWRWLFSGLSGLTSIEQDRLTNALLELAQTQRENDALQIDLNNANQDITDLNTDLGVTNNDLLTTNNNLNQEQLDRAAEIQTLTDALNLLQAQVNCIDGATGAGCP